MTDKMLNKGQKVHIGKNIRKARLFRGVKQQALASVLNTNQRTISEIEQKEQIEEDLIKKIAYVLGLPIKVIKSFDENAIVSIAKHNLELYYADVIKSYRSILNEERSRIEGLCRSDRNLFYDLPNTNHSGKKIETIRRIQNVTQSELGKALGITKQAVSKMEHSKKIKSQKIKPIAKALGVSEKIFEEFNGISELNYNPITHDKNIAIPRRQKMKDLLEDVQTILKKEIENIEKLKQRIK